MFFWHYPSLTTDPNKLDATSDYISQLLKAAPTSSTSSSLPQGNINSGTSKNPSTSKSVSYWLLTATFEGSLALINLQDDEMRLVYTSSKFFSAPKTLVLSNQLNSDEVNKESIAQQTPLPRSSSLIDNTMMPSVQEILMISVGYEKSRPMLIARIEEDLIVYEAFVANEAQVG